LHKCNELIELFHTSLQTKTYNFVFEVDIMQKILVFFLLCFVIFPLFSQTKPVKENNQFPQLKRGADSIIVKKKKPIAKDSVLSIEMYKIISHNQDTVFLDTTLTIQKDYRYNFLRKDAFELMPFANVGQPYNSLGKDFDHLNPMPSFVAQGRHFGFFEKEDVRYYHVPTPLTELMFKTTMEQGQLLDALLTFNTSPQLNISLAYKGFRSLGKYQFNQAQSGSFRTSFNYRTKNNRYWIRGHMATQDIQSEENGGISNKELQFESGDEEFLDRGRVDVRYNNANNRLFGRRYFIDHQYSLIKRKKDSLSTKKTSLDVGHTLNYDTRFYQFLQSPSNNIFGSSFISPVDDKSKLQLMHNSFSAIFSNKTLGTLKGSVELFNYNYFFNSQL